MTKWQQQQRCEPAIVAPRVPVVEGPDILVQRQDERLVRRTLGPDHAMAVDFSF